MKNFKKLIKKEVAENEKYFNYELNFKLQSTLDELKNSDREMRSMFLEKIMSGLDFVSDETDVARLRGFLKGKYDNAEITFVIHKYVFFILEFSDFAIKTICDEYGIYDSYCGGILETELIRRIELNIPKLISMYLNKVFLV